MKINPSEKKEEIAGGDCVYVSPKETKKKLEAVSSEQVEEDDHRGSVPPWNCIGGEQPVLIWFTGEASSEMMKELR